MAQILAVDDSRAIRQMMSWVLGEAGHTVTVAEDGVEGLEAARSGDFDLVITDVHMPNMSGIELIEHLRELPDYRFRPLLVLTTDGSTEMKQKGRAAGATGWILKPVEPETLTKTTERVLGVEAA